MNHINTSSVIHILQINHITQMNHNPNNTQLNHMKHYTNESY